MGVPLPESKWRPWAELPEVYLRGIFRNLPFILDHARFSGVCIRWRETARTNPPRFPFPWLMMPSTAATSFFCVACRATHHRPRLPWDARGARLCGSFPGGWLVPELPWPRGHYSLLNLLTGARVPCHGGGKICPVVLHAVTLSAAPSVGPCPGGGQPSYAAAIVAGQSNIAFWCSRGVNCWFPPNLPSADASDESWHDFLPKDRVEDVIYFSGNYFVGFYALTDMEDLLMFWPEPDDDGTALSTFTVRYSFPDDHRAAEPAPGQTVSRYLVVSRGELLMIVRFAGPGHRTRFDVLALEEKEIIGGADHNNPPRVLASWRRCCNATTLRGRRIFLGRGCSVAVDVGYPFPLYIYFLDDGRRPHGALPTAGNPPYPCSDTGGFWFFNKVTVPCLP